MGRRKYYCPKCGAVLKSKRINKPGDEYTEFSCDNCGWWTFDIDAVDGETGRIPDYDD